MEDSAFSFTCNIFICKLTRLVLGLMFDLQASLPPSPQARGRKGKGDKEKEKEKGEEREKKKRKIRLEMHNDQVHSSQG